jgi:hypothetical protein
VTVPQIQALIDDEQLKAGAPTEPDNAREEVAGDIQPLCSE